MIRSTTIAFCLLVMAVPVFSQSNWQFTAIGTHILGGTELREDLNFDWFSDRTKGEIELIIGEINGQESNSRQFNQGGIGIHALWSKPRKSETSKFQQFLRTDLNYHSVSSPFYEVQNLVLTADSLTSHVASLSLYQRGISVAGSYGVRYDLWKFKLGTALAARVARTIDSDLNFVNRPSEGIDLALYNSSSYEAANSTRISANIPFSIDFQFLKQFEIGYTIEFGGGLDISDTAGSQWFATRFNQGVQLRVLIGANA